MDKNLENFVEIVSLMEQAKQKMEYLRDNEKTTWNSRALSIAITNLETSQLWLANAKPE